MQEIGFMKDEVRIDKARTLVPDTKLYKIVQ